MNPTEPFIKPKWGRSHPLPLPATYHLQPGKAELTALSIHLQPRQEDSPLPRLGASLRWRVWAETQNPQYHVPSITIVIPSREPRH